MRRTRTSIVVTIGVVLVLVVAAVYYGTAYRAARDQAVAVALRGPMPGPGLADTTWGVRLGGPAVQDLVVEIEGLPQYTSLTSVTFSFILSNAANAQVPTLPVFVTVELTLRGWKVTANGAED